MWISVDINVKEITNFEHIFPMNILYDNYYKQI